MFCHPATWAIGSHRRGPPAARTIGTKSTLGFYRSDVSPCSAAQWRRSASKTWTCSQGDKNELQTAQGRHRPSERCSLWNRLKFWSVTNFCLAPRHLFGRTLINGSSVARFPERGTDDLFDRFNVAVMNGTVWGRMSQCEIHHTQYGS